VPNGPLTENQVQGGVSASAIVRGRELFQEQQCTSCHRGGLWSITVKDFTPPPALTDIFCERALVPPNPALPNCAKDPVIGNPNGGQYLDRFLRDVGSYNRGVVGAGNELPNNIGGVEKSASAIVAGVAQAQQDALGIDFNDDNARANGDDAGVGFGVSSLLGIYNVPPYGHNGSCETIACVVADVKHRTANGRLPDNLMDPREQARVVTFVESIDLDTNAFP
jgi:cytochrome c peroxidase